MGYVFNPFTGNLDFTEAGGTTTWKNPVADAASLPTVGNSDGDARVTLNTDEIWVWDDSSSRWENTGIQATTGIGSTPNAQGYSIEENEGTANLRTNELVLQPADSSNPGIISTAAQNFAGDKTFDNDVTVTGNFTVNGTTTTVNTVTLDVEDANITVNNNGDQATADANDAGLTVEMSDATNAIVGYDSTLTSKFKVGEVGSESEVLTATLSQSATNKDLSDPSNNIDTASTDSFTRLTGNQSTINIPDPASTDDMVLEDFSQTLTNKTMDADNNTFTNFEHGVEVDDPSSGVHGVTGDVVGTTDSQTLSNKTIDNSNSITIQDANLIIQDDTDNTKQAQFQLSSLTTSTTRTLTVPDSDGQVTLDDNSTTLTNKTMDANNNTFSNFEHGAEVDDPSSGVHGVTGNVVGDTDTQTLENKTIDGTSATGNNTVSIDADDATYDNSTSGLTATDVQAAIDEVEGRVDTNETDISNLQTNKADTDLNNLTATSINQNLDPDSDNTRNVGNVAAAWSNMYSRIFRAVNTSSSLPAGLFSAAGGTSPSGTSITLAAVSTYLGASSNFSVNTENDGSADSNSTGDLLLETGNKTAGTGDSGDINIQTGSSAGGSRGSINLVDGSEGTVGHVWTSKGTGGEGNWEKIGSEGDLDEGSFSIANNQTTTSDVTGLAFANATVRSVKVQYSVEIDATANLYESGELQLVQKDSDWDISITTNGDNSQVNFSVTNTGQVQYTSANYAGFSSGTIKYRAITTSI